MFTKRTVVCIASTLCALNNCRCHNTTNHQDSVVSGIAGILTNSINESVERTNETVKSAQDFIGKFRLNPVSEQYVLRELNNATNGDNLTTIPPSSTSLSHYDDTELYYNQNEDKDEDKYEDKDEDKDEDEDEDKDENTLFSDVAEST